MKPEYQAVLALITVLFISGGMALSIQFNNPYFFMVGFGVDLLIVLILNIHDSYPYLFSKES